MLIPKFLRYFRDLRYRIFYGLVLRKGRRLVSLGDTTLECNWNIFPDELGPSSVVYSGGVGNDISFEHALVARFGCNVVLADPSPTGLATMAKPENRIPQFRFAAAALAGYDGELHLHAPGNASEGSFYASDRDAAALTVPCSTLATLMRQHGDAHIDLLKIDIEGSEYEVLEEILRERLPIRQICVEFHHGLLPGIRRSQSIGAILRLFWRGYELLDQAGYNHTFHWRGKWPPVT